MRRDLKSSFAPPAAPEAGSTAAIVRGRLEQDADRVIVVDGHGEMSRRELHARAIRLGSALSRRGLARGSVVAFQLPNWSEACVISLACALYGFVLCPLLLMYRERELGFILAQTECEALFIPGVFRNVDFPALLLRALSGLKPRIFTVRAGNSSDSIEALLAEPAAPVAPQPVAGASIRTVIFTSGTTGRPKGVLHSHATMAATVSRAAAFWKMDDTDRLLVPSPIGHIGGSIYAFDLPWLTGAPAYLMEAWNADTAVSLIDKQALTFCAGATPFLQGLLDSARIAGSRLPSLRRFICGGASVPPALVEAASRQFEHAVVSRAYGSTEVPLVCPGIRTRDDAIHGQVTDGEVDVELRLEDAQGDILVRSSGMFVGYLDTDDEAGQFAADGFFRMGDLGRIVDGRYLEITGRRKELIIRMGENISPLEVENILMLCKAVRQVAVVGIPDKRTGERAVAFVTLTPGHAFTLADMQEFLARAGLARQKFPEALHVVEALPTTTVGKIVKSELRRIAIADTAG